MNMNKSVRSDTFVHISYCCSCSFFFLRNNNDPYLRRLPLHVGFHNMLTEMFQGVLKAYIDAFGAEPAMFTQSSQNMFLRHRTERRAVFIRAKREFKCVLF